MSTKPLWYRWARVYVAGGSIVGFGVLLFYTICPTDEKLIASFSPEVRADYEKNRELRQQEQKRLMEIAKQTAASNDPIWKAGPIGSPFEKEQRNLNMQLIDKELFHKTKFEEQQKEEIDNANQQMKEVEQLLSQKKNKPWWKFF
ncbi:CBP4 Assembly factor CBP4 [Candida maltosa Xu316]